MSKIFDSVNVYGSGTTTGATFRTFDSSGNNTVIIRDDGKVGIGTTTPTAPLQVQGTAIPSTNENLAYFTVSDAPGAYFGIGNGTTFDGSFHPKLFGRQSSLSNGSAANYAGVIDSTQDSGSTAVVNFQAHLDTSSPVVTRPIFQWSNWSTKLMTMDADGNLGIGNTSPTSKLHITNTSTDNSFLVEDQSSDSSPFVIDNNGNVGIGVTGTTYKLDVNGTTFHRDNVQIENTKEIFWSDTTTTWPTSINNRIRWTLNNDFAAIYAFQPSSDDIDFVFKIADNANTSLDNYVFWIDNDISGGGEANDAYPLEMNGLQFIVNPLRRYATIPANSGAGNTDFYVLKQSATTLSQSVMFADVSTTRVGINTSTPSETLDVNGKIKTTNLQITSGAVSGYLLTSDNNGNATWQVNSATTITINNNSNNRIITATGNNDEINGESNLTFDGNTLTSIKNSSSPNLIIRDTGTTSTDAYIRFLGLSGGSPSWAMGTNKGNNSDFEIRYGSGSNTSLGNTLAFAIQSASTGFYTYQFGPSNAVKIVTAGDSGQIRLRDNASGFDTTFTRFTNYSAIAANNGGSTDETFYINNDSNSGRTSFGGGGVGGSIDQMEFYPDPRTDLPVNGGSGLYIKNNLSVDGTVRVGSVTSTGVAVYRNASTGILTTTSSDVRLKKDITQITNPLDIINNLRGVYYNWQSNDDFETDDTTRQIGLIAQEVEPVLPEAVVLNGVKDYKTVKYSEIVSVLIEGMKEQQKMINDLKQEIENLKNP